MPESSHPEYTVEVLEKVLRLVAYAGSGESSIIFEDFIYFVIRFGSILANLYRVIGCSLPLVSAQVGIVYI